MQNKHNAQVMATIYFFIPMPLSCMLKFTLESPLRGEHTIELILFTFILTLVATNYIIQYLIA
jgi:hypothetical protein